MIRKHIAFTFEPAGEGGGFGEGYIVLDELNRRSFKQVVIDENDFKGELVLDLDENGKIIGIEILGDVIPDSLKTG